MNGRGFTYYISTTYTYVAGNKYYTIDYIVTSPETTATPFGGEYWLHIYLSEPSFMGANTCGRGVIGGPTPAVVDEYYNFYNSSTPIATFYNMVGVIRSASECADPAAATHLFKTDGAFSSFASRPFQSRDDKSGFYLLSNMLVNSAPFDMGVAAHKAINVPPNFNSDDIQHLTKQFVVGFDAAEMAGVVPVDPELPNVGSFGQTIKHQHLTVNFNSTTPEGLEGDDDHAITGLELKIGKGYFYLPQILEIVATPIAGPGNAVPGTDYEVIRQKIIIPGGIYWDDVIPVDNIKIIGNNIVDGNRKFHWS